VRLLQFPADASQQLALVLGHFATSWITVTASGSRGNGAGSVTYSVASNTGAHREGTIRIAGQTFEVRQRGF